MTDAQELFDQFVKLSDAEDNARHKFFAAFDEYQAAAEAVYEAEIAWLVRRLPPEEYDEYLWLIEKKIEHSEQARESTLFALEINLAERKAEEEQP